MFTSNICVWLLYISVNIIASFLFAKVFIWAQKVVFIKCVLNILNVDCIVLFISVKIRVYIILFFTTFAVELHS